MIKQRVSIQETKDINTLPLEELMGSFLSHEIELIEDKPKKKSKSILLKFKGKKIASKMLQTKEELDENKYRG